MKIQTVINKMCDEQNFVVQTFCDEEEQGPMTKINSCEGTQKLKQQQNSKTQIVTKLKIFNFDKT